MPETCLLEPCFGVVTVRLRRLPSLLVRTGDVAIARPTAGITVRLDEAAGACLFGAGSVVILAASGAKVSVGLATPGASTANACRVSTCPKVTSGVVSMSGEGRDAESGSASGATPSGCDRIRSS